MAGALTAAIAAAFAGSAAPSTDPYFEYTTLLLPGSGTNGAQNNTFLDGSTNNFTITRNGNTTQGTFSPFSQTGWSAYFSGSNQLTLPSALALAPEAGQFCIEFWIYPIASWGSVDRPIFVTAGTGGLWVGWQTTAFVLRAYGVTNHLTYGTAPTLNTWTHVAICRNSGNTTSMYFNGSRVATGTVTQNFAQAILYIGADTAYGGAGAALLMASNLSNLRLVKGSSVYDPTQTTITVPTTPLTAISGTSLLACQSNRFIDNSTNNFTITRNGDTRVIAFSPFNPTASWSAATNGGSGYFDGNGDYLNTTSNTWTQLGTGDFTVEGWAYINSYGTYFSLVDARSSASFSPWFFGVNSSGYADFFYGTTSGGRITDNVAVGLNNWVHLAAVRNGSTITLYVNGVSKGTATYSSSINGNSSTPSVGRLIDPYNANGYISNLRVVIGTAVYTSAFTPPTAPLTAITNTSLLLNFTNAGIYDATSKNDLETVGNAQISNTTAKFGSTSMSFDGSGDWLKTPASTLWQFGTGDFTIEFWWYPNSLATFQQILSVSDNAGVSGAGQFAIIYNTSLGLRFYINAGTTTINQGSTSGWSAGQWYYIAAVRSGNTLTLYRDGSSIASGSVTGVTIGANIPVYIGGEPTQPASINGYLQDVRITNGYARPVTTSPTAAFPTL